MYIKRTDDYALIHKIETLKKKIKYVKRAEFKSKNFITAYVITFN